MTALCSVGVTSVRVVPPGPQVVNGTISRIDGTQAASVSASVQVNPYNDGAVTVDFAVQ